MLAGQTAERLATLNSDGFFCVKTVLYVYLNQYISILTGRHYHYYLHKQTGIASNIQTCALDGRDQLVIFSKEIWMFMLLNWKTLFYLQVKWY